MKIWLQFPELSNDREIKIFVSNEEQIRVRMREIPGMDMIQACMSMVLDAGEKRRLVKMISEKADSELVDLALKLLIEPEYRGMKNREFLVREPESN